MDDAVEIRRRASSLMNQPANDLPAVCAYAASSRVIAGIMVAASGASLPILTVRGLLSPYPIPLFAWYRALGALALLPAIVAWLMKRATTVDVQVRGADLVVRRRGLQVEIPRSAIERVIPWTVPLPGPGFSLRMRSGRRFRYGLQCAEPTPLLSWVAEPTAMAAEHPTFVYARAKRPFASWRWYQPVAKFIGFALVPAAVMFNLQQHVAYGGLFGQYYIEGLAPYLKTLSIYWGLSSVYLLLYASVWRGLAEGLSLLAAWVAPARAAGVRRAAEIACQIVYYGGVPVLMAVPFLR